MTKKRRFISLDRGWQEPDELRSAGAGSLHVMLRNQVVLARVAISCGMTMHQLGLAANGHAKPDGKVPGNFYRWLRGQSGIRENGAFDKLQELVRRHGASDYELEALYKHPVWELLVSRNLADVGLREQHLERIEELLQQFRGTDRYAYWAFPDRPDPFPVFRRGHLDGLAARGDLDAFAVILGLLRIAEARIDPSGFLHCLTALYNALPGLAADPAFFVRLDLIRQAVERISRCEEFAQLVWVDERRLEHCVSQCRSGERLRRMIATQTPSRMTVATLTGEMPDGNWPPLTPTRYETTWFSKLEPFTRQQQ